LSHRLVIRLDAQRQLYDIADALTEWTGDRETGRDFIERIVAKCGKLAALGGKLGRSREDFGPGLRSSPLGHYLIVFRYDDPKMIVVSILDGRRDLPTLGGSFDETADD